MPADCQLTDDDVTAFVNVLQPRMFLLMFGKGDSCMVSEAFQNLALLRPAIIIPPLLDRYDGVRVACDFYSIYFR